MLHCLPVLVHELLMGLRCLQRVVNESGGLLRCKDRNLLHGR